MASVAFQWRADPWERGLIVRQVLGSFDFGTSYRVEGEGRQPDKVLKLPRTRASRPHMVEAQAKQARALSLLERRGRAVTLDVVEVDGRLALLRPWIEGRSLEQLLVSGPIPGRAAAELLGRVANLLHLGANAFDRRGDPLGLIHASIHPGNIILGRGGKVDLVDWGVGSAWLHSRLDEVYPSRSPMAPERVQGHAPTEASDIWELGVMVDAMLATSSEGGPELAELASRLLAEDPAARPEAREVARICSAVVTQRPGPRLFDWIQDRWESTSPLTPPRLAEFPVGSEVVCVLPRPEAPVARAQVRVRPMRPGEAPEPPPQIDYFAEEEEDDWDPDEEITEEFGAPPSLEGLVPAMVVPSPSLKPTPAMRPAPPPPQPAQPIAPPAAAQTLSPVQWVGLIVAAVAIGGGLALALGYLFLRL